MNSGALSRAEISRLAAQCGLAVTGVASAERFDSLEQYFVDHIEQGFMKGLPWFTTERARQCLDPSVLHSKGMSIISLAVPYWSGVQEPPDDGVLRGQIARYAWGRDYHNVLKRRMKSMVSRLSEAYGSEIDARILVDTARTSDRAVAARAGTGWYGKNSMIIVPGHGSWVMLGEIIVDITLPRDIPIAKDCGRCTFCLDRCPTAAIVEPFRVDANRCISFLTIEERGPIPHHLRPLMGKHVFGCDVCQEVCPYTNAASPTDDEDFQPSSVENMFPSLEFLATMTEEQFRETYSGTPVTRAKRSGMARNAAIALGNSGNPLAEPILIEMLTGHDLPIARGHAAVALHNLVGHGSRRTLLRAIESEVNPYVVAEIKHALSA